MEIEFQQRVPPNATTRHFPIFNSFFIECISCLNITCKGLSDILFCRYENLETAPWYLYAIQWILMSILVTLYIIIVPLVLVVILPSALFFEEELNQSKCTMVQVFYFFISFSIMVYLEVTIWSLVVFICIMFCYTPFFLPYLVSCFIHADETKDLDYFEYVFNICLGIDDD